MWIAPFLHTRTHAVNSLADFDLMAPHGAFSKPKKTQKSKEDRKLEMAWESGAYPVRDGFADG
jgi:hypothetical protein